VKIIKFRLGELFCGPGGLALGALNAKVKNKDGELFEVEHSFANDNDVFAFRTYVRNICKGDKKHVIHDDVRKLDLKTLPDIDALAFGFPCNDFSVVGEQKGLDGDFGPLYLYGVKVLDLKKPKWFLAENVGGLRSSDEGNALKKIMVDLMRAGPGYEITAHLYKFEEYGVPQKRHRIIIVGIDKNEKLRFKVPKPTTKDTPISVKKALECPPIPVTSTNQERTVQSKKVIERLKHIPEGENAWYKGLPEHLKLNVKGAFLSQIYKRLKADEPSYTLTGSGGGGTHGYHWSEPRALTNRERARIQTFPDDYIFDGGKEQVRKQIGMAVPPQGAKLIIEAILKTFAGIPYESVEAHWEIEHE
jgi:DNA (cytosine-5)-methyltransferase 1